MSACATPASTTLGASVRRAGERLDSHRLGVEQGEVDRQRRRRDDVGHPVELARAEADVEVGAERLGDLLGEELAQLLAR